MVVGSGAFVPVKGVNTALVDLATTVEGAEGPRSLPSSVSKQSINVAKGRLFSAVRAISCYGRVNDRSIPNRAKVEHTTLFCLDMHNMNNRLGSLIQIQQTYLS